MLLLAMGFAGVVLLQRIRARRSVYIRCALDRISQRLQTSVSKFGYRAIVSTSGTEMVDFEWTNSKSTKPHLCRQWNRLCGGVKCLEDKRILGLIMNSIPGALQTYSITSWEDLEKIASVAKRLPSRFWVLKDSRANGAAGIWFLDLHDDGKSLNRAKDIVCNAQQKSDISFCLQEYCPQPLMLYEGRKFHLRITAVVCASGMGFVHRLGFLHPANKPFVVEDLLDNQVQLTNLCINMHQGGREICMDVKLQFPNLWPKILDLWANTVETTFQVGMRHQRVGGDFEYVGLDIMANEAGEVFLLEINSPPALYSATGQLEADEQHQKMLNDLFEYIVCPGLVGNGTTTEFGGFEQIRFSPTAVQRWDTWHSAQSKCDLLLMRFLLQQRKRQDLLWIG
ncbi:hypothetical protein BASA81_002094 [Batrachochytrium salamandrivorans]|nr:hypothetical protein BASA81_002094 [Batrachochytrium salamandrivorans]